ncbi:HK97 gp10 family phage protein [Actinoplanes sp. NPDC051861]|uniref:HK97 gp10 family phage protein n=1 Tax=Actinoplanes sp. NPDC051861 TaxID=3155170 RepID=UPI003434766D
METRIAVGGLAQLNRGLRAIDNDAPKQLRLALNDAATLLVERARPKVPSVSGAARRSMVARSTRTSARVAVGGKKAPYFPWLEFGGQGRIAGRPAAREFLRDGRYVYPTLRQIRPQIEQQLQDSITAVIRGAGLEAG